MFGTPALLLAVMCGAPTYRYFEADISPPEPLPLGGYTARNGKVMDPGGDPLFARILVLQQSGKTIAIVSLEMLTVPESLVKEVQDKVGRDVHLFLTATHTHSAPDSQMLNSRMTFAVPGIASYKSKWLNWFSDKIAAGIKGALTAPFQVIKSGSLGQIQVDANRGRRVDAKPDQNLTAIYGNDQLLALHYAAHATFFEEDRNQTSGDWPGMLMKKTKAVFLPGAIGDASPVGAGSTTVEKVTSMVEKLDTAWRVAVRRDVKVLSRDIAYCQVPIELPEPKAHPDFIKQNGVPEPLAQVLVKRFAPPEAVVTGIRYGDLLIIGIPGEPTSEIGAEILTIARKRGFPHTLVVSHVNGWLGYILSPENYDKGGYEATLAFHGRELSGKVVAAATAAIDQSR